MTTYTETFPNGSQVITRREGVGTITRDEALQYCLLGLDMTDAEKAQAIYDFDHPRTTAERAFRRMARVDQLAYPADAECFDAMRRD